MQHRYTLESYSSGRSRHNCPNCGHAKEFTRYVDTETGAYLDNICGKCNRESKCGYHYKPRQFFADNPNWKSKNGTFKISNQNFVIQTEKIKKKVDFINEEKFLETLKNYEGNNFVRFLLSQFSIASVNEILKRYFIGTWADGRTVFWQIDKNRQIRTGKLMLYDAETGRRIKGKQISWVHSELKRKMILPSDFSFEQCFFGEYLLSEDAEKPVAIVESEKTAVVANLCMPKFLWLATGGSANLKAEKLQFINQQRQIVLFPDSSKFEQWTAIAQVTKQKYGSNIRVFDLLEKRLSSDEKKEDYDIADFLLKDVRC